MTDTSGRPIRLIGTNRDVTPERDHERDQAAQLERERRGPRGGGGVPRGHVP